MVSQGRQHAALTRPNPSDARATFAAATAASTTARYQYVWDSGLPGRSRGGGRYIDSPVLRDEDLDSDGDCTDDEGTGSERLCYANDANFNVTALIETDGAVAERTIYDAYGQPTLYDATWSNTISESASKANEIRFCRYVYDAVVGLYTVRYRVYDPALGRWVQRDPAGYVEGADLYEYVLSSPAQNTDPYGLEAGLGGSMNLSRRLEERRNRALRKQQLKPYWDDYSEKKLAAEIVRTRKESMKASAAGSHISAAQLDRSVAEMEERLTEQKRARQTYTQDAYIMDYEWFTRDDVEVHIRFSVTLACDENGQVLNKGTDGPTDIVQKWDDYDPDEPTWTPRSCPEQEGNMGFDIVWGATVTEGDMPAVEVMTIGGGVGGFLLVGGAGVGPGGVAGAIASTPFEMADVEGAWRFSYKITACCKCKGGEYELNVAVTHTEHQYKDNDWWDLYTKYDP